jgi:hypothetical protein
MQAVRQPAEDPAPAVPATIPPSLTVQKRVAVGVAAAATTRIRTDG